MAMIPLYDVVIIWH